MFEHLFGFPGSDPQVLLIGFVFLVALGIDYNIFLMTRAREESIRHGTRDGVLRALAVTGGVITSAGLVLAATFGALTVLPLVILIQLGFLVGFGVLLDTFVVRTLMVPAAVRLIGDRVWWPSALAKGHRRARERRRTASSNASSPSAGSRQMIIVAVRRPDAACPPRVAGTQRDDQLAAPRGVVAAGDADPDDQRVARPPPAQQGAPGSPGAPHRAARIAEQHPGRDRRAERDARVRPPMP